MPDDAHLQADVVESARLVGLSLFSKGELSRAKILWTRAFALAPRNEKLIEYLNEVDARLEGLRRIKEDESSP